MKCNSKTSQGTDCLAMAMHDSQYCFRHNPNQKRHAKYASSKGGQRKRLSEPLGAPRIIDTPKDIQILMSLAINSLWSGKMHSNNPAGSLGYLAKVFLEAYEKNEIVNRIELLEKLVQQG